MHGDFTMCSVPGAVLGTEGHSGSKNIKINKSLPSCCSYIGDSSEEYTYRHTDNRGEIKHEEIT